MANNYYDEFSRLPLDKMAQAMEDITYLFEETKVPKKHYKQQLSTSIEEVIEQNVELNLIDTYYRTLEKLKKENSKWFFQALLCLDMKIKPSLIKTNQLQALEVTYAQFCNDKNDKILNKNILDYFQGIEKNGTNAIFKGE